MKPAPNEGDSPRRDDSFDRKISGIDFPSLIGNTEEEREMAWKILDSIGDSICIQDRDFRVIFMNAKAKALMGERIGSFCYEAFEGEKSICPGCGMQKSFEDGKVHVTERTGQTPDGPIQVEITTSPLRDAEGEIVAGIEVVRDISRRRRDQEIIMMQRDFQTVISRILRLSLSEEPLEELLGNVLDLLLSLPWLSLLPRGAVFLADEGAGKMRMVAEKNICAQVKEECAEIPVGHCLCGEAAASRKIVFAEHVDERHRPLRDKEDHGHYCVPLIERERLVGVLTLYLEVGHRQNEEKTRLLAAVGDALSSVIIQRQALDERDRLGREAQYNLEAVSRSQKEWLDTFDTITDMIFITSPEGIVERANRAFSDYFALSPDEVIGRPCFELFPGLGGQALSSAVSPGREDEVGGVFEYLEKNRSRLFRGTHFPRYGLDRIFTGRVCIMRDITEEKETEARLVMTERLASLGQVSAGIAHEINNPLASIASCAEALRLRVEKGKIEAGLFGHYLSIVEEEVTRCKKITTGMLSLVGKTLYEKKLVDIREVIDRALEILTIQRSLKGVEVVKRYAENLPHCRTSEGEIRQVLLILIGNAIEAMGGSGRLTLTAEMAEGHLVFSVGDSGPGISGEQSEKIFEPFFTTKTDSGGTGLGLPIARRILGLYRGRLEVSSRPGEGATFTIFLPLGEEEREGPGSADPAGSKER